MIRPAITRPASKPRARILVSCRLGVLHNDHGAVLFHPVSGGEVEIEDLKEMR